MNAKQILNHKLSLIKEKLGDKAEQINEMLLESTDPTPPEAYEKLTEKLQSIITKEPHKTQE